MKKIILYIYAIIITTIFVAPVHGNDSKTNTEKLPFKYEEYKPLSVPDDVAIFDIDGNKHYFEEFEGKTLLVVFWATWCAPCVQEMLDLDMLQKDFRKLPFVVIPISEDYNGVSIVSKFYKDNEIRHLALYHDYRNSIFNEFKVIGMPTSFVITPDGKNVASFKGSVNWYDEEVRKILLSHIPGNPVEPKNSYKDNSLNQMPSNSNKVASDANNTAEKDTKQDNQSANNNQKSE